MNPPGWKRPPFLESLHPRGKSREGGINLVLNKILRGKLKKMPTIRPRFFGGSPVTQGVLYIQRHDNKMQGNLVILSPEELFRPLLVGIA